MARGDKGINPLDAACRVHDIAYSESKNIEQRHQADRNLAEQAWKRVFAKDSSIAERASAYLVTNAMKAKVKFGMGMTRKQKKQTQKKKKTKCNRDICKTALKNANNILKQQ